MSQFLVINCLLWMSPTGSVWKALTNMDFAIKSGFRLLRLQGCQQTCPWRWRPWACRSSESQARCPWSLVLSCHRSICSAEAQLPWESQTLVRAPYLISWNTSSWSTSPVGIYSDNTLLGDKIGVLPKTWINNGKLILDDIMACMVFRSW